MFHLKASPHNPTLPETFSKGSPCIRTSWSLSCKDARTRQRGMLWERQRTSVVPACSTSASTTRTEEGLVGETVKAKPVADEGELGNLVSEFGWRVRKLVEEEDEMWKVTQVQSEAFHVPVLFFNDVLFEFFKAEVFSGLLYKLRNSPPNRYACLIAEPSDASDATPVSERNLVGVVDVTVMRDDDVLSHLEGADEYLYISGIAVLEKFRRRKVATVLLKACDLLSLLWGFDYLALRAYEDDSAARKVYTNAGYKVVSGDPLWMTTLIGRKRRVLMIKQSSLRDWF